MEQISQRTPTMFVGVVALRYQQCVVDNGVPQLSQTQSESFDYYLHANVLHS